MTQDVVVHPALQYAARGWPVVPLHSMRGGVCSCGQANDAPKHTPGKHPRTMNGLKDGTTDPARIQAWLAQWPDANWAICTGPTLVIDIDIHKGGADTWARLTDGQPRELLETIRQKTGSGGAHFIFLNPPADMFRNSNGALGPGIDTRGVDGYIVAPPSNHVSGGVYEWVKGHAPGDHDVLPLPTFLVDLLRAGKKNGSNGLVPHEIGERIPRGRRDSTLLSLAGSLRGRATPQSVIEATLLDVNKRLCDPPHDEKSVLSMARRYRTASKDVPTNILITERLDDDGNGVRLASLYGHEFRYVHEWEWMVWEDSRWIRDTQGRMEGFAKATVRTLTEVAMRLGEGDARNALLKHAKSSGNMQKLRNMIAAARSEPGVPANVEDFDSHDGLLNAKNCVIDLATGTPRPHDPNLYMMGYVDIAYDANAKCPRWDAFFKEFCCNDQALMDYLQRCVGYTLTGYTNEQCLFFLFGDGSNGKSLFISMVNALLGSMGTVMNFSALLAGRDSNTENALASLYGKRMASAVEAGAGRAFNEELLKALTGEDQVRARYMYQDGFTYQPKFKAWLAANDKPAIRGSDHGIWRRPHVIPCQNHVPDHKQDKSLKAALLAELPGILAWAVRGAAAWHIQGLKPPEKVLKAVEEYRNENDSFSEFIAECCTIDPTLSSPFSDLQAQQIAWSEARGEKPMTSQALGRRLAKFNAGILTRGKKDGGYAVWHGIGVGRNLPAKQGTIESTTSKGSGALNIDAIVGGISREQHDRMRLLLTVIREEAAKAEKETGRGFVTETLLEEIFALKGWTNYDLKKALETLRRNNSVFCKGGSGTYAPLNPSGPSLPDWPVGAP